MPPKKATPDAVELAPADVERRIRVIRGVRVMLDAEIAELYGIPTKALNQAVARNLARFPLDFSFILEDHEVADLRSQNATSNAGRGGRRYNPRAFTEEGVAMLSSVLNSNTAIHVNIEIMRAFVRMRRLFATPGDIVTQLQQLSETVQVHDTQIKAIIDALQRMLTPPPADNTKRRIGFTDHETPSEEKK